MKNIDPAIRNAVRAVVLRNEHILLLRKEGGGQGERFALPGGAQDAGETLVEALNRECLEEIGTAVRVKGLLNVADYFKQRDTELASFRHVVEFFFACSVADDYQPGNGYRPDKHQVGVVWKELSALDQIPILPKFLGAYLANPGQYGDAAYLGKIE